MKKVTITELDNTINYQCDNEVLEHRLKISAQVGSLKEMKLNTVLSRYKNVMQKY